MSLTFSIVELPAAMYYRDPYRDRLRHGWTCRVLNGEVEVAIDAPVVHHIWRLQHLLTCMSIYHTYPTGDRISAGWAHPFQFASVEWYALIMTTYQCTKRTADGQSRLLPPLVPSEKNGNMESVSVIIAQV